jgi:uncharacterized membrane protein YozB (DUF420 family)
MTIHDLPAVNATLNGLSAVLITAGWISIKSDRKPQHIFCMASAVVTSTIFLACYLTYHFSVRIMTKFPPLGWIQKFYYVMLTSHVLLAFVTLPLVILTLIPALRARYDKHRRIARWTMPIWLYVSVTGVLVYMMLYQWFPPAANSAVLLK